MRRTKSGKRNKQDWSTLDHLAAGHSPVAPPLTLAMTNIGTSAANLESAARALKRIDEPYYAAQVVQIVRTPRRRRRHAAQADTAAEQAQGERD